MTAEPPWTPSRLLLLLCAAVLGAGEAGDPAIDLATLHGAPGDLAVVRSSAFFVPKTPGGFASYLAAPDGRQATRISLFEQALAASHDEASFIAGLERHRGPLARLCRTTSQLVIVLAGLPAWLGTPPRDEARWRRTVQAGVRWFAGFPGPLRTFEVWNEPDLATWPSSGEAFLRFYEATAAAIHDADPEARIGGAALNGWRGGIPGDAGGDLDRQLIRRAAERHLPLDVVSWHWFSPDPQDITAAAADYRAAARGAGLDPPPDLMLSEWNLPAGLRQTPYAPALHAEVLARCLEAGIRIQTVAAWEDFEPGQAGDGLGLVTQAGARRPAWHVHGFFDAAARDAAAWSLQRAGAVRLLGVRGSERRPGLRLVCWQPTIEPRTAALAVVRRIPADELAATYGDAATILAWVGRGRSRDGRHDPVFAEAQAAQAAAATGADDRCTIRIACRGLPPGAVLAASAVKRALRPVAVARQDDTVVLELERNEVAWVEATWP